MRNVRRKRRRIGMKRAGAPRHRESGKAEAEAPEEKSLTVYYGQLQ